MLYVKHKHYLTTVYVFVLLLTGTNAAYSQSDDQLILNNLMSGNRAVAQTYMDRLSSVDAGRLQCLVLMNFNYVFDYERELYSQENLAWLLDSFLAKGYSWPSSCDYRKQTSEARCLIFGIDLSSYRANWLWQLFESMTKCLSDNLNCASAYNNYADAEYTDTYLYVVERYFSEAALDDRSRNPCPDYASWTEAVLRTHTAYLQQGWTINSELQLQSVARSLQKSLDRMQALTGIDRDVIRAEYESQLASLADTSSIGAIAKYSMFIATLMPSLDITETEN